MTDAEAEWLTSVDPQVMLEHVMPWASERKLRLWACACCRRIWRLMKTERARRAVETSERYADGEARMKELKAAYSATTGISAAELAAGWTARRGRRRAPLLAARFAAKAVGYVREESEAQADLLHEIFGEFFHPVEVNPAWLAWNDGTVRNIGVTIYQERTFEQMPILADALEDAGCNDVEILQHCRKPDAHVRGCWVLDLLLGKE
jgi:hypothetical protein